MNIDPNDAAASLADITTIERRTREARYYAYSGLIFMLWGTLTATGYLLTFLDQGQTRAIWLSVTAVGFAGTFAAMYRRRDRSRGRREWRIYSAMVVLMVFGALFFLVLGPWEGRQHSAFWPLLVMMGFVLGGIWMGRFFVVCGIIVAALILIGYYAIPGPTYDLWLAAVEGGGIFAAGWWMRRTGLVE